MELYTLSTYAQTCSDDVPRASERRPAPPPEAHRRVVKSLHALAADAHRHEPPRVERRAQPRPARPAARSRRAASGWRAHGEAAAAVARRRVQHAARRKIRSGVGTRCASDRATPCSSVCARADDERERPRARVRERERPLQVDGRDTVYPRVVGDGPRVGRAAPTRASSTSRGCRECAVHATCSGGGTRNVGRRGRQNGIACSERSPSPCVGRHVLTVLGQPSYTTPRASAVRRLRRTSRSSRSAAPK